MPRSDGGRRGSLRRPLVRPSHRSRPWRGLLRPLARCLQPAITASLGLVFVGCWCGPTIAAALGAAFFGRWHDIRDPPIATISSAAFDRRCCCLSGSSITATLSVAPVGHWCVPFIAAALGMAFFGSFCGVLGPSIAAALGAAFVGCWCGLPIAATLGAAFGTLIFTAAVRGEFLFSQSKPRQV